MSAADFKQCSTKHKIKNMVKLVMSFTTFSIAVSHFGKDCSQFINRKYMNGANISKFKLKHLFNTESESELNFAMFTKIILGSFTVCL